LKKPKNLKKLVSATKIFVMTKPKSWALCTEKVVLEKYHHKFENIFWGKVTWGAKFEKK
jgi:hypothetical protein